MLALSVAAAGAVEYPIGTPEQRYGMEIAAVYLQPVVMEPDGIMRKPEASDVYMEADIRALGDNPTALPRASGSRTCAYATTAATGSPRESVSGGGHQARTYMTPDAAMNASLEGLALPVMSRSAFRAFSATRDS